MSAIQFATGLVDGDSGVDAFAEAAARAAMGLGGAPCDVALVFAGQDNLAHAGLGLEAVHERLRPAALAGCGAQGVVGTRREVETGGVVVWAASLGEGQAEAFHLEAVAAGEGRLAITGMPDVGDDEALVMFVDPYTFPAEALLAEIARSSPGVPALERLQNEISALTPEERALAASGLLVGIVIDENRPEYDTGDFLMRGLLGADEATGALAVGESVRVGQTLRFFARDAASADADLQQALAGALRGRTPAGALLFTCNGRGLNMFDTPDHDARAVAGALGSDALAGFFCGGEIGPVGGKAFLHGFTATLAVFLER
jgi:small ligand-binding sensory domain FIST